MELAPISRLGRNAHTRTAAYTDHAVGRALRSALRRVHLSCPAARRVAPRGRAQSSGVRAKVFDPNCCSGSPQRALERELLRVPWDVIGVSTTGMTLRFDLELAHLARRIAPDA